MEDMGHCSVRTMFDWKNGTVTEWTAVDNQEIVYTMDEYCKLHFDEYFAKAYFAAKGQYVDVLARDEDPEIRKLLARNGFGLDVLVSDRDWTVRMEVAKQGYGLNVLVNDDVSFVANFARAMVQKENVDGLCGKLADALARSEQTGHSGRDGFPSEKLMG